MRATQARLENIQKARAARKRAPLPWRSGLESRIIEQLVWQWWVLEVGGRRLEAGEQQKKQKQIPHTATTRPVRNDNIKGSGERKQKQVPHRHPAPFCSYAAVAADRAGWVRDDNILDRAGSQRVARRGVEAEPQLSRRAQSVAGGGQVVDKQNDNLGSPRIVARAKEKPWAKYRMARFLGVSHTWVNKLVKRFEADPDRMRRKMAAFAPASIEKLERAREETRRQRELGWLRGPIRWRLVKVKIQGKKQTVVAVTAEERRRREMLRSAYAASGSGATGRVGSTPASAGALYLPYREVPEWAKGFQLPGTAAGPSASAFAMNRSGATRTPRPVPFAFRRRR